MAIWIDSPIWTFRGVKHAHMISDSSLAELHHFAFKLGFPERAFQGDHYDIPEYLIPVAEAMGAGRAEPRELLGRLKAAGLRSRPAGRANHHGDTGAPTEP
ncbi:MAG: DUF4031 domain-containing protein [Actinomycetota bacterium]|nr:DUF4031 domain-containing protein [Actinomycetota bacterium]MDA8207993.1 DUF4031 domain-containing protein [Actinomycetota bacterium]